MLRPTQYQKSLKKEKFTSQLLIPFKPNEPIAVGA